MPRRTLTLPRAFPLVPDTHLFYRQALVGSHLAQVAEGLLARAEEVDCEHLLLRACEHLTPQMLKHCRGVIAPFYADAEVRKVVKHGVPVVNVSNTKGTMSLCANVISDDVAVGRAAAGHLLDRGCSEILVLGMQDRVFSDERARGAIDEAGRRRRRARVVLTQELYPEQRWGIAGYMESIWQQLGSTIESMPPDSGIFAVNDIIGWALLRVLENRVPERVFTMSIIGADNAELGTYSPRRRTGLSSVQPGFRQIGARSLDLVLDSGSDCEAIAGKVVRVRPERIVERASSAGSACADPLTARLVRALWSGVREGRALAIEDLAREHGMTRRTLERRFTLHLGMPARDFVANQRIEFARYLLSQTTDPIGEVAARCGFAEPASFSSAFRKATGLTPSEFREGEIESPRRRTA